jgi:hypothetical protein
MGYFCYPLMKKKFNTPIAPQIHDFTNDEILWIFFNLLHINAIQAHTFWAKDMGQPTMLLRNILGAHSWMHIAYMLSHLITWVEIPFLI